MTPAVAALDAARRADPWTHRWGLYLSPAAGEADSLLWFASPEAAHEFVALDLWPALSGSPLPPDLAEELAPPHAGAAGHGFSWDRLEGLNLALEPVAQIHWWGSLKQLYEGEDPFAKDLREAWRQGAGRGPQDFSGLNDADAGAFCQFLRDVFTADDPFTESD
jgi:hypothetical protein